MTGRHVQAGKLAMIRRVLEIGGTSTPGAGDWNASLLVAPVVSTMPS
ncbi:hypothetical protein [Salinispora arenicola]|nr:hypothetical protein [Salinispora arenicola]